MSLDEYSICIACVLGVLKAVLGSMCVIRDTLILAMWRGKQHG